MNQFNMKKLKQEIRREEGKVMHKGKHVAYQDHLGYWTIGYGHLIDRRKGGGISEHIAELLLESDINHIVGELDYRLEWFSSLSDVRQRAIINMAFQLGVSGLLKFKKMLAALEAGDFETASKEALDSKWAQQTPARAGRIARMIKYNKVEVEDR